MKNEKDVAGVRCGQVLEQLSAYLDGELAPAERSRLEAHVRDCELCTRFGGVFGAAVLGLRKRLQAADEIPADVAARLEETLRRAK